MNAEGLTDLLNTYPFLRGSAGCEYQLCKACGDETELDEPIDAFPRLDAIRIVSEVLFGVPKGCFYLPSLLIIRKNVQDLKRQICGKDAKILIRF